MRFAAITWAARIDKTRNRLDRDYGDFRKHGTVALFTIVSWPTVQMTVIHVTPYRSPIFRNTGTPSRTCHPSAGRGRASEPVRRSFFLDPSPLALLPRRPLPPSRRRWDETPLMGPRFLNGRSIPPPHPHPFPRRPPPCFPCLPSSSSVPNRRHGEVRRDRCFAVSAAGIVTASRPLRRP